MEPKKVIRLVQSIAIIASLLIDDHRLKIGDILLMLNLVYFILDIGYKDETKNESEKGG